MEPPGCFVFRLACAGMFGETDVKYDESPHDSPCPITSTACTEMYQSERVPPSPKTGVGAREENSDIQIVLHGLVENGESFFEESSAMKKSPENVVQIILR